MTLNQIPLGVVWAGTALIVLVAIEIGYLLGRASNRRPEGEKAPAVSSMSGAILGLLAFMLAFTFGIVGSRYDARKALVREEANSIRSAWLRSDCLPEAEGAEAKDLLTKYVDLRVAGAQSHDLGEISKAITESNRIQRRLWDVAVENARKNPEANPAALYLESLNQMINVQATRIGIALQARIPDGIWFGLYTLLVLAMVGVGYHTAVAGSRRSWAAAVLAIAFSVVIAMISVLDRPQSTFITVSQQPLIDLRESMR
jgi:hypothetical protein